MKAIRKASGNSQPADQRSRGLKILLMSLAAGAIGITPLVLYIMLGPKDGNPIGLGLLAMLAIPVAAIGSLVGLVTMAVEFFIRPRS
jgi:hypothetical protein